MDSISAQLRKLSNRRQRPTLDKNNARPEVPRAHRAAAASAGCGPSQCPEHGDPPRNRAALEVGQEHRENHKGWMHGQRYRSPLLLTAHFPVVYENDCVYQARKGTAGYAGRQAVWYRQLGSVSLFSCEDQ